MIDKQFWQGKKIFLTGHTGFKGSWLSLWLQDMGAVVRGYALTPPTTPNLFDVANVEKGMDSVIGDIRDYDLLYKSIEEFQPAQIILVDSMFSLARAAEQGVGVALIPMPVSQSWFNSGALVAVSDIELVSNDYYCVANRADPQERDSAELLSDWITREFSEYRTESMHHVYSTVA